MEKNERVENKLVESFKKIPINQIFLFQKSKNNKLNSIQKVMQIYSEKNILIQPLKILILIACLQFNGKER